MRAICLGALILLGLLPLGCKKEERPNYPTAPAAPASAPGAPPAANQAKPDNSIPAQDFRDGKG